MSWDSLIENSEPIFTFLEKGNKTIIELNGYTLMTEGKGTEDYPASLVYRGFGDLDEEETELVPTSFDDKLFQRISSNLPSQNFFLQYVGKKGERVHRVYNPNGFMTFHKSANFVDNF